MDNVLQNLLESDALDENLKASLKKEWETKLEESRVAVREEVENDVRAEFARRFENDRGKMVEAMDKFMSEAIEKELREFNEDRKEVFAARAKLAKQLRENNEEHATKMSSTSKALEGFVLAKVKDELKEFMIDKKDLVEARKADKQLLEDKQAAMDTVTAGRINSLEKFIVKKLSEEIGEFETDKKELIEQKVRMAREAKNKLDETRKNFVKRSASLVESTLKDTLTKEFTEMREDIRTARENHFGRKMFEAFAAEYMTSYLSEGSEVKKLQVKLDESKRQTSTAITKLEEQQSVIGKLNTTLISEKDRIKRDKLMTEMLSTLGRDNKAVMEEILSNVKTERLREAFNRHLPAVLNESKRGDSKVRSLNESATQTKSVATGDRVTKKVAKATERKPAGEEVETAEVVRIQALAGIK